VKRSGKMTFSNVLQQPVRRACFDRPFRL